MSARLLACAAGEPLSWLTLERFHLEELEPSRAREVQAHLGACAACRACLERIEADRAVALRPLPTVATRSAAEADRAVAQRPLPAALSTPRRFWRTRAARISAAALVAAAALLLVVLIPHGPDGPPRPYPPRRVAFKGGDLVLSLVRARGDQVLHDPTRFAPGDRFKVLVTSPATSPALAWDLVVYQDGEASFPLTPHAPLAPGNREPLPGAFSITGKKPVDVCLVIGTPPPSRAALARGLGGLTREQAAACARLWP